jgi:DNA replication protein DnaC
MTQTHREEWERISKLTPKERAELKAKLSNEDAGNLNEVDGYDCPMCKNRGFMWEVEEEKPYHKDGEPTYRDVIRDCQCKRIRMSIRRLKRSGLEPVMKRCTFDRYEVTEDWQETIKSAAEKFPKVVNTLNEKWFFIGGGVGSGKTHLCTAIARELLWQGKEVRYMLWVKESQKMKAVVNEEAYNEMLEQLQNVEVLYIDDFFKPMRDGYGQEMRPTSADIRLAYEIINHRYQHQELITIISSERHIGEIEEIDSAVGSRIYEMTKQNAYNISKSRDRNYRLKDMNII